jgi:molecular chaperone HscB
MPSTTTLPSHFDRLGLPQSFAVDLQALERNYLAKSRELHPDFHQSSVAAEQKASLNLSAALNEAYAALRDPFRRAEYLLQLAGGPSAAQHKDMPAQFLEEMLELRMEIEEIREAGRRDTKAAQTMGAALIQRREKLVSALAEQFGQLEDAVKSAGDAAPIRIEIRRLLNSAKYIQGLLRDLHED